MRAFTIWQPWASLIMIGAKPYEFRGRCYLEYSNHPSIGERIVIHAGARPVKQKEIYELLAECKSGAAHTGLILEKAIPLLERLTQAHKCRGVIAEGAALGTAIIGQPRKASVIFTGLPHDSDRGDFNWAWPLTDIVPFVPPVPACGMQGFWHFDTARHVEVAD